MRWTLPNILTTSRLLAAPLVALIFLPVERPLADWIALGLFIAAAVTDFLDGWLARRQGTVTAYGRMLDPIADKALTVIALAVLLGIFEFNPLLIAPVTLILLREVFISGLREFLGPHANLPVTKLAKWKTTAQLVAIAVLLTSGAVEYGNRVAYWEAGAAAEGLADGLARAEMMFRAGLWLIWIAAILTVVTGLDYLRKAWPHIREE